MRVHLKVFVCFLLSFTLSFSAVASQEEQLKELLNNRRDLVVQLKPLEALEQGLIKEVEAAQTLYQSLGQQKARLEAIQLWNAFITFMGGYFDLLQKTNPGNNIGGALVSFLQDRAGDELKKREPDFQMRLERASTSLKQLQPNITRLNYAMNMNPQQVADQLFVRGMVDNSWVQRWQQTPDAVAQTKAVVSGKITFILEEINATRSALYAVRKDAGSILPSVIKQRVLVQNKVDELNRQISSLSNSIALQKKLEETTVEVPEEPTVKLDMRDIEDVAAAEFATCFALIESEWNAVVSGTSSRQDYETAVAFAQKARDKKKTASLKPFFDEYMTAYRAVKQAEEAAMYCYAKNSISVCQALMAAESAAGARYAKANAELDKQKEKVSKSDQEEFIEPLQKLEASQKERAEKVRDFQQRFEAFLSPPLVPGRDDDRNFRTLTALSLFGNAFYGLPLDLKSRITQLDQALVASSLRDLEQIHHARAEQYQQLETSSENLKLGMDKAQPALAEFMTGVASFAAELDLPMLALLRFFGGSVKLNGPDELWAKLQMLEPQLNEFLQNLPNISEINGVLQGAIARNQQLFSLLGALKKAGENAQSLYELEKKLKTLQQNFETDGYRPSNPYRLLHRFDNQNAISAGQNDQIRALLASFAEKDVLNKHARTLLPDGVSSSPVRVYPEQARLDELAQQRNEIRADIAARKTEYERLYDEVSRGYTSLDAQLSNLSRSLLPISPIWAYEADISQFAQGYAPNITAEDPQLFPDGDDNRAVFEEYIALVQAYNTRVNKKVKQILSGFSGEEDAERTTNDETDEVLRQREQHVRDFYQQFTDAYESKNDSILMGFLSDDWEAGDGTTLFDVEDSFRNMFNVFDEIRFDISGMTIQPLGKNRYLVTYESLITGRIFDTGLEHEEKSAVSEEIEVNSSGRIKIMRTPQGRFWYVK